MELLSHLWQPEIRAWAIRPDYAKSLVRGRNQRSHVGKLGVERTPAGTGEFGPRPGPVAVVALADDDQPGGGERLQMPAEIAVGHAEQLAQVGEVCLPGLGEHRHDREPGSLVHDLVKGYRR